MLNKGELDLHFCRLRASKVHFRKKKKNCGISESTELYFVRRRCGSLHVLIGQASSRKGHGI